MTTLTPGGQRLADALASGPTKEHRGHWRCPACPSRSYDVISERKADGSFAPSRFVRCLDCKGVSPALEPTAGGDGGLREALIRLSSLEPLGGSGTDYDELAARVKFARNALAQRPAPQALVADAAGLGRIPFQTLQAEPTPPEEAKRLLVQHAKNALADVLLKYAPQFDYDNAAMADALFEAGALVDAALTPPQAARPGDGEGLTLRALHTANIDRQAEWCPDQVPDLSFRGNELAGETGEACNVIKKLERERQGWRGSRATLNDLAEELADVVIRADLCAVTAGIDLDAAVVAKFNATSDKVGISVRLPAPVQTDAAEGRS